VTAEAAHPTHTFELMPKERVVSLLDQLAAARRSQRLPRAKNEIWYLGSHATSGGWRATRVDVPAV